MPLYEYKCNECGHEFEELVSFAEADAVVCENCGSKKTERLASTFCGSVAEGAGGGGSTPPCFGGGG
jgi:putative FmdB family regulatory protein